MAGYSGNPGLHQGPAKATLIAKSDGCPRFFHPLKPRLVKMRTAERTPSPVRNQPLKSADQLSFAADGSISGCLRDGSRARRDRGFDSPSRCRKSPIVLQAGQ